MVAVVDVAQDAPNFQFIRAERRRLRNWLTTNIPVQWNRRVRRVEYDDEGVTVHFEDGGSAKGDILIGADGINSVGTLPILTTSSHSGYGRL